MLHDILGAIEPADQLAQISLEMALDDRLDDGALAVEVAVDEPGTDAGSLRDVRHAGGVKAALDEALLGRIEDALALACARAPVAAGGLRGALAGSARRSWAVLPPAATERRVQTHAIVLLRQPRPQSEPCCAE